MKLSIVAGSTSESTNVFIQDSTSTVGAGKTGLVFNTASLTAYYSFTGANATSTAITLATLATVTTAWSSGGFKELDATNMPGWYRFDIPNAVLATSKGRSVSIHFRGATGMADCPVEIELTGWNNQDAVRGGMTALPNAAANANGGLPILSSSGTALAYTVSTVTTLTNLPAITTDWLTGTGVAASAVTKIQSGLATPTNITAGTITTVTNLTNAPTAGDFTATMKTSIGTAVAASAVASVTGNVGGNVVGSVGSVVAAIVLPTIPANWITAAGIATDAIDADAIATDAISEIQSGLSTLTAANVRSAVGLATANLDTQIAGLATPTNITAATGIVLASGTHTGAVIPTVTNLTNAPTSGDFTATMKTSIGTAVAASAVASVTGNVGGNVVGSVGSVTAAIVLPTIPTDWIAAAGVKADAVTKIQAGLATPTNITAATGIVLAGVTHTGAVIPAVTTTTTVTNLTNAPTAGDFTATMKTSIGTAVAASAVASVTGNVGGNVVGSVGSLATAVIKKNTALANFEFMMTDSSSHSPSTGKTVTCTRSIDGSSFAGGTLANVTEVAFGIYRVDFGTADLNGNVITLRATATGCDDTFITLTTTP